MPWKLRPVRAPEDEVWRRWKQGQAFSEIGRALGTCRQTIFQLASEPRRRGAAAATAPSRRSATE